LPGVERYRDDGYARDGPTYFFGPPRVFETLLTQVMIRMEDAARIKRALFQIFSRWRDAAEPISSIASRRCADRPPALRTGQHSGIRPLRNVLGMSRIRVAYTAVLRSARIVPLLSIDRLNLKQFYGSTETCAYVCPAARWPDQVRHGRAARARRRREDLGRRRSDGEVRLDAQGILPAPADTQEVFDQHGYFRTGDAGFFDADGHLKIIDRAKDVGKLANGAVFAPNYIENKLKFFQYVKEAVAFGNARDHVCAFINIDLGAVGNWAERRGIPIRATPISPPRRGGWFDRAVRRASECGARD
jgi:long-chain acyl-CoA synthetase